MTRSKRGSEPEAAPTVPCAIYTRKSTDEGLEKEFNSLDAQRESAEAYIKSQAHAGWTCLPDEYDDGGFTGGNMERPALKRLLTDIESGKVRCVVVYKVDRLSRSLLDFARMMEVFDRHGVSFVSVTQQFNTASSMGRLVLNVLLSFAQFEREIISERTRDKIAAARRKGKWSGGRPILGYDVDSRGGRLLVNDDEAARVQGIFELYLELGSVMAVVRELNNRGWVNKQWTTRGGSEAGGTPFNKNTLCQLLSNVIYAGKVRYKREVHPGEHPAIVDPKVWQRVQSRLQHNRLSGGADVRNRFGALLKGLLRCTSCNCAMVPSHTTRAGKKRYRYYVCSAAQKKGWDTCPAPSIPAGEIEQFLVEQIKCIGRDERLLAETWNDLQRRQQERTRQLEGEIRQLDRRIAKRRDGAERPTGLEWEALQADERRRAELSQELQQQAAGTVDYEQMTDAMADFAPLWESLTPREQVRTMQLLVARVDFDGREGKLGISFQPMGLQSLAKQS
jgi:site-specific DNA recombinase